MSNPNNPNNPNNPINIEIKDNPLDNSPNNPDNPSNNEDDSTNPDNPNNPNNPVTTPMVLQTCMNVGYLNRSEVVYRLRKIRQGRVLTSEEKQCVSNGPSLSLSLSLCLHVSESPC